MIPRATVVAALAVVAGVARAERVESHGVSYEVPAEWKAAAVADVSTDGAMKLTPPAATRDKVAELVVLVGTKKITDADLDLEAGGWHAAHLKNRTAWGVRSDGGMPREVTRLANRRAVRYRDRVGSALGQREQTLTCLSMGARLVCVLASATVQTRDDSDAIAAALLTSVSLKRR